MTLTDTLSQRLAVAQAIEDFCEMANNHPTTTATYGAPTYTPDVPGDKFTRIIMDTGGQYGKSVHAFVDNLTGDLIKAAGWKAPAKGKNGLAVRYNLLTEMDVVEANFTWSGGYLYNDWKRKPVAS